MTDKEARKLERENKHKEAEEDRELILKALREVLSDPQATTAQRLLASSMMDRAHNFHMVPDSIIRDKELVNAFKEEFERKQGEK